MLCKNGPFNTVTEANFIAILRAMSAKDLLMQDSNKLLLHGTRGERVVNHYSFYAAFPDSQDYRLRHAGKELGTLPIQGRTMRGDVITFAGRRWMIDAIDHEKRIVDLIASGMGKLPRTGGQSMPIHTRVRQEMRAILAGDDAPAWLDTNAKSLLQDARRQYKALQLATQYCVSEGSCVYLFLWSGDQIQDALVALLINECQQAENNGICITVKNTNCETVKSSLKIIAGKTCPSANEIIIRKHVTDIEKWDLVLPDDLFLTSYASRELDLDGAHALCQHLENSLVANLL